MLSLTDKDYWYEKARIALRERLKYEGTGSTNNEKCVKNVILLVGDGMGMTTLTAARIFKGQREGQNGESNHLAWELFPALSLVKVLLATQLSSSLSFVFLINSIQLLQITSEPEKMVLINFPFVVV